jgi:hypothetical protein
MDPLHLPFSFVTVQYITHPSNHRCHKFSPRLACSNTFARAFTAAGGNQYVYCEHMYRTVDDLHELLVQLMQKKNQGIALKLDTYVNKDDLLFKWDFFPQFLYRLVQRYRSASAVQFA